MGDLHDAQAGAPPGWRAGVNRARPFGNPFEPGARGWITRERSTPGHIGDPRQASAVKGEILFRLFAGDVAAFLDRVIAWDGRSWDG
ncbi:MAG: hypothetical protein ACXWO3_19360 [Isosphaeraceae bacterium]